MHICRKHDTEQSLELNSVNNWKLKLVLIFFRMMNPVFQKLSEINTKGKIKMNLFFVIITTKFLQQSPHRLAWADKIILFYAFR